MSSKVHESNFFDKGVSLRDRLKEQMVEEGDVSHVELSDKTGGSAGNRVKCVTNCRNMSHTHAYITNVNCDTFHMIMSQTIEGRSRLFTHQFRHQTEWEDLSSHRKFLQEVSLFV